MNTEEFHQKMKELPEPPANSKPPYWDYWRHELWQHGISQEDPEGFAGWPCIYHTMRVDHWLDIVENDYEALSRDNPELLEAAVMPEFGYPKDTFHAKYSAALVHQAHHLHRFSIMIGKDIHEIKSVFEVGGGYGQMALVLYRYGFRGKYVIFDLPEFALLQEYYLSNLGVKGVTWKTDPKSIRRSTVDLLVACYSISEMDFNLRRHILHRIASDYYLFLYTVRFAEYGNEEFFETDLRGAMDYVDWYTERTGHLPGGNYYMFGKRLWDAI